MRERWGAAAGAWLLAVACGPVLGTVWWLVAPSPQFDVGEGGAVRTVTDDWFGADAWFLVLGAVLGIAVGVLTARRWVEHPVAALLGMAVGLVVAALLGWWLGGALGPDSLVAQLDDAVPGDRLTEPLGLRATGVLVVPAFLGVLSFAAVVASRAPVAAPTTPPAAPAGTVGEPLSPLEPPPPAEPR